VNPATPIDVLRRTPLAPVSEQGQAEFDPGLGVLGLSFTAVRAERQARLRLNRPDSCNQEGKSRRLTGAAPGP